MSETPESTAGGTGGARPIDYGTAASFAPGGSGMLRLGGALGIAASFVGLVVMVSACAGLNKVVVLSIIPVALSLPGLVISVAAAIFQKRLIAEDTHVLQALFVNMMGL